MMKYFALTVMAIAVVGCGERLDGHRIMNVLFWMGEHPILAAAIFTVLTPFIAMIPVVGVPFSAIWARIGIALIPALEEVAEARERQEEVSRKSLPDRTLSELGSVVVGDLANEPTNPVGRVPGAKLVAGIAARAIGRRVRRRRRKKNK